MFRSNKLLGAVVLGLMVGGCDDHVAPDPVAPSPDNGLTGPTVPAPLETVNTPFGTIRVWPFTGVDVQGTPSDPVNLIFFGESDVRSLRVALMFLDGDRTALGLPGTPPFDCTWTDAVGGSQTAYVETSGWSGSAVQLECGDYDPIRFHIRLFPAGDASVGSAHFEVIIPGTSSHQVLSWELAKQLVTADLARTGLLDASTPMFPSDPLHPSPYRTIPEVLYNQLPPELKGVTGGPAGDAGAPVPIWTDGTAMAFNVARARALEAGIARRQFTIPFDQVIPKPFCAPGAGSFLYVQGSVEVDQRVRVTPSGTLRSTFQARGTLELTPVDPTTQPPTPLGETYAARVRETQRSVVTNSSSLVSHLQVQAELPRKGSDRGRLKSVLRVGPGGSTGSSLEIQCDP
jgi:hypothetical protein